MPGTPASTEPRGVRLDPADTELLRLFAIPVLRHQWRDVAQLNRDLREMILERWHATPGVQATNVGGWHSERDLHRWSAPCVRALLERIEAATAALVEHLAPDAGSAARNGWSIEAWANVTGPGDRNAEHVHDARSENLWSGVYYVDDGGSDAAPAVGGRTVLVDPSRVPRERTMSHDALEVEPRPGLMLLFPATLPHRADPYQGSDLRVTIAFNLSHPDFVLPSREPQGRGWKAWMWRNFRGVMLPLGALKNALRDLRRPGPRRPG